MENEEKESGFRNYILKRFGIEIGDQYYVEERGRVRIYSKKLNSVERIEYALNKGINSGRINKDSYKPSTDFIQLFGFMATRNVVFLNKEELKELIKKRKIKAEKQRYAKPGYVILFYNGKAIGVGLLKKEGILESNIPKYRILDLG